MWSIKWHNVGEWIQNYSWTLAWGTGWILSRWDLGGKILWVADGAQTNQNSVLYIEIPISHPAGIIKLVISWLYVRNTVYKLLAHNLYPRPKILHNVTI